MLTSPRTGEATGPQILVQGLYTSPDVLIDIQLRVGGTWQTVKQVRTSDTAAADAVDDDPRYGFQATVDASSVWPAGGLLHLRAQADGADLISFWDDLEDCRAAQPSWRDAAPACGNAYTEGGVTLVDTDVDVEALVGASTFLDDKGLLDVAETAAYYVAIDAPATVADFRARYILEGEVTTRYYNEGDLATGREMHCARYGAGGIGCYVANYGIFGSTRDDAEALLIAGVAPFATVAMTSDAAGVNFMVYGPDGALVNEAILDTHGDNASIPANCTNCHGSDATYDLATHRLYGAKFLAFDPSAFHFVDGTDAQAFSRLNQLVLATAPATPTKAMIAGLAADGPAWVADGWKSESASHVYREVIAPYCRGCHGSREGQWDFTDWQSVQTSAGTIKAVVCDGGNDRVHRMPNAEATQRRFWQSRARAYLGALVDLGDCTP